MIDSIAATGDAGDINCWSGIPYHFAQAAHAQGEPAAPWRLEMGLFGAALAEAIALGLPCVVTDVGPMREVGGEDGAVCYVRADSDSELAASATELLGDYPRRCLMSERSRARAEARFDGACFAEKIKQCLLTAPEGAASAASFVV